MFLNSSVNTVGIVETFILNGPITLFIIKLHDQSVAHQDKNEVIHIDKICNFPESFKFSVPQSIISISNAIYLQSCDFKIKHLRRTLQLKFYQIKGNNSKNRKNNFACLTYGIKLLKGNISKYKNLRNWYCSKNQGA